ncbi:MAG: thioesterase [Ignavibacteriaceae bacterium]|nr:MAG: acyl-CoA thioesterase [Chlorobiota bacterium]GJQ31582.1 MAG: thioesterase [Ignavibacteriaceae bacterium]
MFEYNGHNFYHVTNLRVRFQEVDMLGVCNNAVYVSYFEQSRLEYIKEADMVPPGGLFSDGFNFFMVRNEINYRTHARYDDELNVYTRISYIGNSSYGFEHVIVKVATGEVVVDGSGVVTQVDQKTGRPHPLSDEFVEKVETFEKRKFERGVKK